MEFSYDSPLMKVFDSAFDIPVCFMLLHEQNSNWWEGDVANLTVIYGLKDLAVALFEGLEAFGYERLIGKDIGIQKGDDGRILLDVPFREKLTHNEQGVTRFILYPLRGAGGAVGK